MNRIARTAHRIAHIAWLMFGWIPDMFRDDWTTNPNVRVEG